MASAWPLGGVASANELVCEGSARGVRGEETSLRRCRCRRRRCPHEWQPGVRPAAACGSPGQGQAGDMTHDRRV